MEKKLDKIDLKLMSLLQENARYSLKQLAQEVFLSSPAVSARLEQLEQAGYIVGYTAKIDPIKMGYHITAFINLEMSPDMKSTFYPFAEACPNAVSYTHLDVYKRQAVYLSGGVLGARLGTLSQVVYVLSLIHI